LNGRHFAILDLNFKEIEMKTALIALILVVSSACFADCVPQYEKVLKSTTRKMWIGRVYAVSGTVAAPLVGALAYSLSIPTMGVGTYFFGSIAIGAAGEAVGGYELQKHESKVRYDLGLVKSAILEAKATYIGAASVILANRAGLQSRADVTKFSSKLFALNENNQLCPVTNSSTGVTSSFVLGSDAIIGLISQTR
jgi:hypothetical protein